jgi:Family of unknown function (DUF5994)
MASGQANSHASGNVSPAQRAMRLMVKPGTAVQGQVDGGWWPWSTDPAVEFAELVMVASSWVGPISRLAYDPDAWDATAPNLIVGGWAVRLAAVHTIAANTVLLSGTKTRELCLLVIPPSTPGGVARAVLRSASGRDTVATAEEILASNGIRAAIQSE